MYIYLVGGAVRDRFLGRPQRERDWLVVGSTAATMEAQGYYRVGRDFPVFLHPQTGEEYALARTERKQGVGHHGFSFDTSSAVTIEQDLSRRDLTINAMAEDSKGHVIDPYGGQDDLKKRLLRHVSEAFIEDPLRVFRVARFAAVLAPFGFTVADSTCHLMRRMGESGELLSLPAERIWRETERALCSPSPDRFFSVLRDCGVLALLFPELDRLFGVPQSPRHHPEIDSGRHVLLVLQQAARLAAGDSTVAFAALCHDFGKAATPPQLWPQHADHEAAGLPLTKALCSRLKVPLAHRRLALLVTRWHGDYHRAMELSAADLLQLLDALDTRRQGSLFASFLLACEADSRGRPGYEQGPCLQSDYLRRAAALVDTVDGGMLHRQGLRGAALGTALRQRRVELLQAALQDPAMLAAAAPPGG